MNVNAKGEGIVNGKNGFKALSEPVLGYENITMIAGTYFWNDPTIIYDDSNNSNNSFMMLVTSPGVGYALPIQMWLGTSSDGIHWNMQLNSSVFAPTPNLTLYDSYATETPSVVYFKGQYHMFDTAEPSEDPTTWSIGHAVADSLNGPWTKDKKPIIRSDPAGYLNSSYAIAAEPGAVVYNGKIYVYFSAVGLGGTPPPPGRLPQRIAVMTSSDAYNYSAPSLTLIPDENIYPYAQGWIGYSTPTAVVIDNYVHLYFGVYKNSSVAGCSPSETYQVAVHHAWSNSTDGVSNWIQDESPIFVNTDFTWTQCEIRAGYALVTGDVIHLWFAGQNVGGNLPWGGFGIGYSNATISRSTSTPSPYPSPPVKSSFDTNPSSSAVGIPVSSSTPPSAVVTSKASTNRNWIQLLFETRDRHTLM